MKREFLNRVIHEGSVFTRNYVYIHEIKMAGWETISRRALDCYGHVVGDLETVLRYNPNTEKWETQ